MKTKILRIINVGIREGSDPDAVHSYRLCNSIAIFFALVAAAVGLLNLVIYKKNIITIVQICLSLLYLSGLLLTKSGMLQTAKRILMIGFEMHMFFLSLLIFVRINSGMLVNLSFVLFVIIPVLSLLLELNVLRHSAIALLLGIGNYFLFLHFQDFFQKNLAQIQITFGYIIAFTLPITMIGVMTFIISHERRRLEKDIERKTAELQNTVKQLLHSNQTKDRFFSIIAHDLKNPVIGIKMAAENILEQVHTPGAIQEQHKTIAQIADTASNTYKLLERLIVWGFAQSDSLTINPQPVDVESLVKSVANGIPALVSKNLFLDIRISKQNSILADPDFLEAILRNLLSNAAKFSHPQTVIQIRAKGAGTVSMFMITDRGIGIPEKNQDAILSPTGHFIQTGTAGEYGSGIGLLICKELVERHGGRIRVRSHTGQGTTVQFTLNANYYPRCS